MTDKKFTQKEVIKALECCAKTHNEKKDAYCNECKFNNRSPCVAFLCDQTIDLINYLTTTNKNNEAIIKRADELIDTLKAENNRQKAEIEKLNVELVGMRGACESYKMHYDKAQAEIERLDALWNSAQDNNFNILGLLHKMRKELKTAKEDNERHKAEVKWWRSQIRDTEDMLAEFDRPIVEVKNEAIKEFAERLKEKFGEPYEYGVGYVIGSIDNLVKEMTEVDK